MRKSIIILTALAPVLVCAVPKAVNRISVPDSGWTVWLDKKAHWQDEPAFLSADGMLKTIPVHPPTGGWGNLGHGDVAKVTLPTTVEQHFWGTNGLRQYKNEYFYDSEDRAPRNGNYIGVSWWYRTFDVPKSFSAPQIILQIRAAKQRAEVYVNHVLVGYNFVAETEFECDITQALKPGTSNSIAIRITNPGGRLDWGDWSMAKLGTLDFFGGHAFGGLDRGITLERRDPNGLKSPWVMNTPIPRTVTLRSDVTLGPPGPGKINAAIIDPANGSVIAQGSESWSAKSNHGGNLPVTISFFVPNAKLWSPEHPKLYLMRSWLDRSPWDVREIPFGFRWIGPSGVGKKAALKLNDQRIRVYSAISWGFWGINGLWPTPSLAEKEVNVAKSLGLNSLNFHRNIARAEALDAADRLGILRYTEPGGGMTLFWDKGTTTNSKQLYMLEKIRRMVRDHRSHPSLTVYVVQNELGDDEYKNPIAEQAIRIIHSEDPSRPAILKSGINPKGQMWMMPFDEKLYVDKGDGYSGWWDSHTVGTPEAWFDSNYQSPENHVYRNTDAKEIVDYGEMGGSGTADNHALMLEQIQKLGGKSFDKIDHQEINAAYNHFLDSYGFRKAFPTTKALFAEIGAKQYNYWENVIQCARLSDENDYLTISGWETTAVENHSGLVDALRNPHGDPKVLSNALRLVLPAIQLRQTAIPVGGSVTYDLFFFNETNRAIKGKLSVTLMSPKGDPKSLGAYPVPTYIPDKFSYAVAANLHTPRLTLPGNYTIQMALGNTIQIKTIHVVGLSQTKPVRIGILGHDDELEKNLVKAGQHPEPYHPDQTYDLTCLTADPIGSRTESQVKPAGTDDPELFRYQRYGKSNNFAVRISGLPNGPAKVTLGFAEQYFRSPKSRIFDLMLNGVRVMQDFDLFQVAGGRDKAVYETFDTTVKDGEVTIQPGNVKVDNLCLNTVKVEAGDKSVATYFGDKPYTAKDGTVWQPYRPSTTVSEEVLGKVKAGMALLVCTDEENTLKLVSERLAKEGAFTFKGLVGKSRAPWMGSWYIVRDHPLYAGLPVNEVMKGDYQAGLSTADGLIASGPNVEIVTAYSRDHSRVIGAGDLVTKLGKGKVIIHCVPKMIDAFQQRWTANAVQFATK